MQMFAGGQRLPPRAEFAGRREAHAEKMDRSSPISASAAAGSPAAPMLLAGTGRDQVHLLLVCTGERGLSRRSSTPDRASPRDRRALVDEPGRK